VAHRTIVDEELLASIESDFFSVRAPSISISVGTLGSTKGLRSKFEVHAKAALVRFCRRRI